MIQTYHTIFAVSIMFLALSSLSMVFLFFYLKIPRVFLEMTGIAKTREMENYNLTAPIAKQNREILEEVRARKEKRKQMEQPKGLTLEALAEARENEKKKTKKKKVVKEEKNKKAKVIEESVKDVQGTTYIEEAFMVKDEDFEKAPEGTVFLDEEVEPTVKAVSTSELLEENEEGKVGGTTVLPIDEDEDDIFFSSSDFEI